MSSNVRTHYFPIEMEKQGEALKNQTVIHLGSDGLFYFGKKGVVLGEEDFVFFSQLSGADKMYVTLPDGTRRAAKLVGEVYGEERLEFEVPSVEQAEVVKPSTAPDEVKHVSAEPVERDGPAGVQEPSREIPSCEEAVLGIDKQGMDNCPTQINYLRPQVIESGGGRHRFWFPRTVTEAEMDTFSGNLCYPTERGKPPRWVCMEDQKKLILTGKSSGVREKLVAEGFDIYDGKPK